MMFAMMLSVYQLFRVALAKLAQRGYDTGKIVRLAQRLGYGAFANLAKIGDNAPNQSNGSGSSGGETSIGGVDFDLGNIAGATSAGMKVGGPVGGAIGAGLGVVGEFGDDVFEALQVPTDTSPVTWSQAPKYKTEPAGVRENGVDPSAYDVTFDQVAQLVIDRERLGPAEDAFLRYAGHVAAGRLPETGIQQLGDTIRRLMSNKPAKPREYPIALAMALSFIGGVMQARSKQGGDYMRRLSRIRDTLIRTIQGRTPPGWAKNDQALEKAIRGSWRTGRDAKVCKQGRTVAAIGIGGLVDDWRSRVDFPAAVGRSIVRYIEPTCQTSGKTSVFTQIADQFPERYQTERNKLAALMANAHEATAKS